MSHLEKGKTPRASKRVTVTLKPTDVDRIERIASITGQTPNEVIRRALATEDFIVASRSKEQRLLVEGKDGTRVVEFLY